MILKITIALLFLLALVSTPILYSVAMQPNEYTKYSSIKYGSIDGKYEYALGLSPNLIYSTQQLKNVDEAYRRVVRNISISSINNLKYTENGDLNISYYASVTLISPNGWKKTLYTIKKSEALTSVNSYEFTWNYQLNMSELEKFINKIEEETGSRSSSYTVRISTSVNTFFTDGKQSYTDDFQPTLEIIIRKMSENGDVIQFNKDYTKMDLIHEEIFKTPNNRKIADSYMWGGLSTISYVGLGALLFTYSRKYEIKLNREKKKNILKSLKNFEDILINTKEEDIFDKLRGRTIVETQSLNDLIKASDILSQPILVKKDINEISLYVVSDNIVFTYRDSL